MVPQPTRGLEWSQLPGSTWVSRAASPHARPAADRTQEFGGGLFKRMPRRARAAVRDAGICHYLAVFKQRDGSLVQVSSVWWERGWLALSRVESFSEPVAAAPAAVDPHSP